MRYLALHLRRTSVFVRTVMRSLAIKTHKRSSALRTFVYEADGKKVLLPRILVHSYYLRDYLAALLHIHHIVESEVEFAYYVGIMQRCPLDNRSCKLHWVEIRHRRYLACTADLIGHFAQACAFPFRLEFICDSPARRFCRIAEFALLPQ